MAATVGTDTGDQPLAATCKTDIGIPVRVADCSQLKEMDQVYYWSNTNKSWIQTTFVRISKDPKIIRLEHQRNASCENVYVATNQTPASGGGKQIPASSSGDTTPQGVRSGTGATPASAGAAEVGDAAAASGEGKPNPASGDAAAASGEGKQNPASGGSAAAFPAASPACGSIPSEEANEQFLEQWKTNTFIPWLQDFDVVDGKTLASELEKRMHDKFNNDLTRMRDAMKMHVPWQHGTETTYVKFMSVPKNSVRAKMHVSFLSFSGKYFPGNGIYLSDCFVLLGSSSLTTLVGKTIEVRPKPSCNLNQFGWECDGAVINGVTAFIMVALGCWSCLHEQSVPQPLALLLAKITAQYKNTMIILVDLCKAW